MKKLLTGLSLAAMVIAPLTVHADASPASQKSLEERIAELEAAAREDNERMAKTAAAGERIKINGFMSASMGTADTPDDFTYDNGLYDQYTYKADSIVGLQLDAKVNDKMNAVLQLVSRGPDEFVTSAEWAYVGYRPTANDEFRMGRQRTSFYMLSEYLEVGYAYPWARPPAEVYRVAFPSSYDGLSWRHSFNGDVVQNDLKVNIGSTQSQTSAVNKFDAEDSWGILMTSSVGNWQFSADLAGGKLTISNPFFDALSQLGLLKNTPREEVIYQALGASYDNGSFLAMAEATRITADGLLPDTDSGYITLGYRFGKVMPHLTYSGSHLTDQNEPQRQPMAALSTQDDLFGGGATPDLCPLNDPNPDTSFCMKRIPYNPAMFTAPVAAALTGAGATTVGIPFPADTMSRLLDSEQESLTLGVRYDFMPNAAFKVDYTRVLDTHNTFGLTTANNGNYFYTATGPMPIPDRKMDVFRVVVDVTF